MRTIAFYSYKGGTGKSLMAANLALCLSRIGRNCVLIDFDIDTPSLHHKLGIGESPLGKGGIVSLIEDSLHLEGQKLNEAKISGVEFRPVPNVKQYGQELDDLRDRDAAVKKPEYGKIRFFAAGNVRSDRYWEVVWSTLWHELFSVLHRYERGIVGLEERDRVFEFLRAIKSKLVAIGPKTDYLIVDCRSGASDLTSTLIEAWLDKDDKLVYMFGFNEESLTYLDDMIRRSASDVRDRLMLVLSRVPTNIEFKGDSKLNNVLRKLDPDKKQLNVIHSDRDIEGGERLRLGLYVAPELRMMTKEYLTIFQKLIRPDHWSGYKSLSEAVGFSGELVVEEKERLFRTDIDAGALINPDDRSRNVSFKVQTFQLLLQGLNNALVGTTTPGAALEDLLRGAGKEGGSKFGEALLEDFQQHEIKGLYERIEKWCKFDSSVGFGRFELDATTIEIRGQRLLRCDITLHQSFLTPAKDLEVQGGAHRYCKLMEGYIEGVLAWILNVEDKNIVVDHIEVSRTGTEISDSCRFTVWDKQHREKEMP